MVTEDCCTSVVEAESRNGLQSCCLDLVSVELSVVTVVAEDDSDDVVVGVSNCLVGDVGDVDVEVGSCVAKDVTEGGSCF